MNIKHLILLVSLLLSTFVYNQALAFKNNWAYYGKNGPNHWGLLDPSFARCGKGSSQSPINIKEHIFISFPSLRINYSATPESNSVVLKPNQCHTQLIVKNHHGIQFNLNNPSKSDYVEFNGKKYYLIQFHFHTPAEHKLLDKSFPMEIHFVHQSYDKHILVLSVFVIIGKENAALKSVFKDIAQDYKQQPLICLTGIYSSGLIPAKIYNYHYSGSLTTPPCTEGVDWIVMKEPVTASLAQIKLIQKLNGDDNARPVQTLGNRSVSFATG